MMVPRAIPATLLGFGYATNGHFSRFVAPQSKPEFQYTGAMHQQNPLIVSLTEERYHRLINRDVPAEKTVLYIRMSGVSA
jgi:hypothetical protein